MAKKARSAGNLELIGGALCLDFCNTISVRHGPGRKDYLVDYGALAEWGVHAGAVTPDQVRPLVARATQDPALAQAAHKQALETRELMFRLLSASVAGRRMEAADLGALKSAWQTAIGHSQFVPLGARYELRTHPESRELLQVLWPVVMSAVALLRSQEMERLRACDRREACGWLFVDRTKNRSRRWCSMDMCGSISKSRRYYQRMRMTG